MFHHPLLAEATEKLINPRNRRNRAIYPVRRFETSLPVRSMRKRRQGRFSKVKRGAVEFGRKPGLSYDSVPPGLPRSFFRVDVARRYTGSDSLPFHGSIGTGSPSLLFPFAAEKPGLKIMARIGRKKSKKLDGKGAQKKRVGCWSKQLGDRLYGFRSW